MAVAPLHGAGHQLEWHALGSTPAAIWPSNWKIPPNLVVQSASAYSPVPNPSSTQLSGAPENKHHKPFSLSRFFVSFSMNSSTICCLLLLTKEKIKRNFLGMHILQKGVIQVALSTLSVRSR